MGMWLGCSSNWASKHRHRHRSSLGGWSSEPGPRSPSHPQAATSVDALLSFPFLPWHGVPCILITEDTILHNLPAPCTHTPTHTGSLEHTDDFPHKHPAVFLARRSHRNTQGTTMCPGVSSPAHDPPLARDAAHLADAGHAQRAGPGSAGCRPLCARVGGRGRRGTAARVPAARTRRRAAAGGCTRSSGSTRCGTRCPAPASPGRCC